MFRQTPARCITHPNLGMRFAVFFLAIFVLLSLAWSQARGTLLERLVIEQATVESSARLISMITPSQEIHAEGFRLISPHVHLSVLNGCEGTESIILLAAAILAYPAPWRRKPAGLLLGIAGMCLLNQLRIVGLFYILRYRPDWFSSMHGLIIPVLILIACILLFILWMNWAGREKKYVFPK